MAASGSKANKIFQTPNSLDATGPRLDVVASADDEQEVILPLLPL